MGTFQVEAVESYITSNHIRYISFDLFDTLVFRSIYNSADVYTLLHRRYDDIYGKSGFNLHKKRIEGEIKARAESKTDDVTIDDIYKHIFLPKTIKEKLRILECEIEVELSVPNKDMLGFLNKMRAAGLVILITTDMYLDRGTIEAILEKHNIKNDYLFLSGEIGLRKDTGKLFQHVLSEFSIAAGEIIHIGDNGLADKEKPEMLGIKAFKYECKDSGITKYFINTGVGQKYRKRNLIERIYNKIYGLFLNKDYSYDSIYSNCLTGHFNAVCKSEQNQSTRIGYGIIGPLMVSLCQWIHKQKYAENLEQLWFVAREGYLIERVYRALYPEETDQIRYVRYNKNVCRLPFVLSAGTAEEKKASLPSVSTTTVENLLTLFAIKDTARTLFEIKSKTGYGRDTRITIDKLDDETNQILWSILVGFAEDSGLEQKKMLVEHLRKTVGKPEKQKIRIGLINNSINGNGQYMLEKILSSEDNNLIDFCGLQFVDSRACKSKGIKYHAWLIEHGNQFYINVFNRTLNVFERLLFENCGTAIGLCCKEGAIKIDCEVRNREKENDAVLIPIQDEAVKFAEKFRKYRDFDITEDALAIYFQMINYPNQEDAEIIGKLAYDEVGDNGTIIKQYSKKTFFELLKNARHEIWPNGYLSVNKAPKVLKDLFVWKDRMM